MDAATTMIAAFQENFPHHKLAADSLLLLGQVAEAKGRADQALALYNSVATGPDTIGTTAEIRARFEIGDLKRRQGDARGAIASWVDLKARFPENNKAIEGLYEAGMLAWFTLQDTAWAKALLNDFLSAGSTDYALVRRAQNALDAINRGVSIDDYKKILTTASE